MGNEIQAADRNDENFRTAINNISYISKKRSESFVDEGEDVFTGKPEVVSIALFRNGRRDC